MNVFKKTEEVSNTTNLGKYSYNATLDQGTREARLEALRNEIGLDTGDVNDSRQYTSVTLIAKMFGYTAEYANMLLQYHGYRDYLGEWLKRLIKSGYIVKTTYIGCEPERQLKRVNTKELASPHGQDFLIEFFELANLH